MGLMASLIMGMGFAQQETQLDWSVLKIDSVLPTYTEVIPLGEDYQAYDYQVVLEYPEYVSVSEEELNWLKNKRTVLPSVPEINTYIGVSRKQGFLDLAFIPVVFQDGQYKKLVSCRIKLQGTPRLPQTVKTRSRVSRYATSSVLAQGRWVKIAVQDDGVYQLSASDLSRMGFQNPDKVKLFGYGGHLQAEVIDADRDYDDLCEVPVYRRGKDILFYANGLSYWTDVAYNSSAGMDIAQCVRNHYANKAYYFLTEGDNPAVLETISESITTAEEQTQFLDQTSYEVDDFAWFSGGRRLFDSYDYYTGNSQTYRLETPGAISTEAAALRVMFSAGAATRTYVEPEVNGEALTSFSVGTTSEYIYGASTERVYKVNNMKSGDAGTTVKLTATAGNHARLDFLELNYWRKLELTDKSLDFRGQGDEATVFCISNPSGKNIHVWRVGNAEQSFAEMVGSTVETCYRVPVDQANARYVAVDIDAQFPVPEYVGVVENQNLHATDSIVDMVIIVPESGKLVSEAERLADAHRKQDGLSVIVVRADQIYNEFSSGTPDATAYRRFLKMLYDRAEKIDEAPRYLLLFGDCAWDNRMLSSAWRGENPKDYLLCFESENSFSDTESYVMEDYFGLLDDGEGSDLLREKVDLGIGRFPITTAEQARNIVDKTLNFMNNVYAGSWKNSICVLGDDGDNNTHMDQANKIATRIETNYPDYDVTRIFWDVYTREASGTGLSYPKVRERILSQMNEGALMMNYTGHGSQYVYSYENVLFREDFSSFTSKKVPLWVTAACDIMPFDSRTENSGELAMLNPDAAAVAFYGTTRTVYADRNYFMNSYFTEFVLGRDEQGKRWRLGDAVRLSKVNLLETEDKITDYTKNKLQYALLGDPALTLGVLDYRVVIDSINGQLLADSEAAVLNAGSLARVSGHIERREGMPETAYNGTLFTKLYDSASRITCLNNANVPAGPFSFIMRDKVLFTSNDSIKNGRFDLIIPIPLDIKYSDASGRMVFYALDINSQREAHGSTEDFLVGGSGTDLMRDSIGPDIVAYLNEEDFVEGATVNATPYFVARLSDESGINTSGNGVGHDLELVIDNDSRQTYNLNDYYIPEFGDYQKGTVAFQIPELSDGIHSLRFRAWDVMNNSSTVTLSFRVDHRKAPELRVSCTENPAKTSTTFLIYHNRPEADCRFTLEIMDFSGRLLYAKDIETSGGSGVYVFDWDLTTGNGMALSTGVYLYRVKMSADGSETTSKSQKIIILRNK